MAASKSVGFLRTFLPAAAGAYGGMFAADTLNEREPTLSAEGIKNAVAEAVKDAIPAVEKAMKEAVGEAMEKGLGEEFEKAMVDAVKKALREFYEERENADGVKDKVEKADEDIAKDV